ncbi:hypothetical protein CJ030_MR6G024145 [Morella rubra]|uniref:Uncharacterized protein n=1 Tax=Morella rubra TaxID=262757 RepID=A0A6A1VER1_9ROSI|nr:hypothetical protein CJ030_MR6G024145 [Morella rubra]
MAEEKESTSIPLSQAENVGEDPAKIPPSSPNSSTRQISQISMKGGFAPLGVSEFNVSMSSPVGSTLECGMVVCRPLGYRKMI